MVVESSIYYVPFNAEAYVTALLGSQELAPTSSKAFNGALSPRMWEGSIIVCKELNFEQGFSTQFVFSQSTSYYSASVLGKVCAQFGAKYVEFTSFTSYFWRGFGFNIRPLKCWKHM